MKFPTKYRYHGGHMQKLDQSVKLDSKSDATFADLFEWFELDKIFSATQIDRVK